MERRLTNLVIKKHEKTPDGVWERFCTNYPWCSEEIKFSDQQSEDVVLATLFISLLDSTLCWAQYQRLDDMLKLFKEHAIDATNNVDFVQSFFQRILPNFEHVYKNIRPLNFNNLKNIHSTSERTRLIKDNIEKSRVFLNNYFATQKLHLASFARGLALSVFARKDFYSLHTLQNVTKNSSREEIIRKIVVGERVKERNFYILEDHYVIPISYQLQVPIHFYINYYDENSKYLPKRRVHAQNEEETLTFILSSSQKQRISDTIQMLPRTYQEQIMRTHQEYYQKLPSYQEPTVIYHLIDCLLQQTIQEYHRVNEFWIRKIVQYISEGSAQTLMSKKDPIQLIDQFTKSLQVLCKAYSFDYLQMEQKASDLVQGSKQIFENLVIANIGVVRSTLLEEIQKKFGKEGRGSRREESGSRSQEVRSEIITIQNNEEVHSQPRYFKNKTLFPRSKTSNETFMKQRQIHDQGRIMPKKDDQDLPDLNENLTENEIDEFSSVNAPSRVIKIVEEENEYRTSEEDEAKKEPEYDYESILHSDSKQEERKSEIIVSRRIEDFQSKKKEEKKEEEKKEEEEEEQEIIIDEVQIQQFEKKEAVPPGQFGHTETKSMQEKAKDIHFQSLQQPSDVKSLKTSKNEQQQQVLRKSNSQQQRNTLEFASVISQNYLQRTCIQSSQDIFQSDRASLRESLSTRAERDRMFNFKPDRNRRSLNLQERMFASQKMNQHSHSISVEELRRMKAEIINPYKDKIPSQIIEQDIEQSMVLEFVCPICYDSIQNRNDILNIHDDHSLCSWCLQDWIKVKFNSGQWNFSKFNCPIQNSKGLNQISQNCSHQISDQIIKNILTEEEYSKLCEQAMQKQALNLLCPWEGCQSEIVGLPPIQEEGLVCPECSREICLICKEKPHEGRLCPLRSEQIKLALQDERIGCCPKCLEIFMKNDGCQHVQCHGCELDFCFACSAERPPIMNHGSHYHREGCEFRDPWINPETEEEILDDEFDPELCEVCQKTNKPCKRPINLELFKKLVQLDF